MTTKVEKSVQVDVPLSTAYNQWTQFEDFPHFMGGVKEVRQLDDRRLHWTAEIAGVRRQWEASILEQVPGPEDRVGSHGRGDQRRCRPLRAGRPALHASSP